MLTYPHINDKNTFYIFCYGFNKKIVHLSGSDIANKAVLNASKVLNVDLGPSETEEGIHIKEELFEQPVRPS
jgi:hypothetical protein